MTEGDKALLGIMTVIALFNAISLIVWAIWHVRAFRGRKR